MIFEDFSDPEAVSGSSTNIIGLIKTARKGRVFVLQGPHKARRETSRKYCRKGPQNARNA